MIDKLPYPIGTVVTLGQAKRMAIVHEFIVMGDEFYYALTMLEYRDGKNVFAGKQMYIKHSDLAEFSPPSIESIQFLINHNGIFS